MESAKKILPYILVAIVFAVGGYFVGAGGMSNQEAAFYKSATVAQKASWNCIRNPQGPGCDNAAVTGVTHDPIGGCIGGRGVTGDPCNMVTVNQNMLQMMAFYKATATQLNTAKVNSGGGTPAGLYYWCDHGVGPIGPVGDVGEHYTTPSGVHCTRDTAMVINKALTATQ